MTNGFISIPREALAELLKASGSALTPEEYVASLEQGNIYSRYPSRARASVWSKSILLVVALISGVWVCLPIGFSFEGILLAVGLATVTFFEYRVHRYFRDLNDKAPELGFRNQSAFAVAILIYGLYHALVPSTVQLQEYNNMLDADTMEMIRSMTRVFYLLVGVVGGIAQFGLAWYYRAARMEPRP